MILAKINNKDIIIRLMKIEIGIKENTKFLLFLLSSAINLEIAIGNPNPARVIIKEKVGIIIIYSPMPSVVNNLDIIIFIIIPNILVIKPPIIKIKVVLIKVVFFILDYMFFFNKYLYKYFFKYPCLEL